MINVLEWDIYEISTEKTKIKGVMLRGRIRKFGLMNNINILAENAHDEEDKVRFAVLDGSNISSINEFLLKIIPDIKVILKKERVKNPVLSKMKVNLEERYTI